MTNNQVATQGTFEEMARFVAQHVVFAAPNGWGNEHRLVRFDNNRGGTFFKVSGDMVEFGEVVWHQETNDPREDWDWAERDEWGISDPKVMSIFDAVEKMVEVSKKESF